MATGNMDGSTRRVSRSASHHPSASTTAGAISISDESSTGSPTSRLTLDLTQHVGHGQAASSSQVATRRAGPSGSHNGHHLAPNRVGTQGGVEPTVRSRSLGGHRAARTARHVGMVEQVETYQSVAAEDIEFLEARALALRERIQQEEDSMRRFREEMMVVVHMTATQRRELQSRISEQEMFEVALREQVHSNRELLFTVQSEVQRNEQLRVEAGQALEVTRARAADEIQQVAHEAAEQIDDRSRRLDVAAGLVRRLQEELRESRAEAAVHTILSQRRLGEYQAEQVRMQRGRVIYDNAVGQKEHELALEFETVERVRRHSAELQRTIEALVEVRQNAIEEARASREAEYAFAAEVIPEGREMRARDPSAPTITKLRKQLLEAQQELVEATSEPIKKQADALCGTRLARQGLTTTGGTSLPQPAQGTYSIDRGTEGH